MQLYYTGAKVAEGPQTDPSASLGGFKSSSLLSNGNLNNLFPTIVRSTIAKGKKDIRMIVLKNTTGAAITSLRIWTESEKYSKVKIAAVLPVSGTVSFEEVLDSNSIPFQASLSAHEGEGAAVNAGSLAANAVLGIWIQRELDLTKFTDLDKGITPDLTDGVKAEAYIAELESVAPQEEDEIRVVFDWS
jgi:hypothetical protein